MTRSSATGAFISCALAGLLIGSSGCSFSIGSSKAVPKDDIVKSISDKMTDAAGNKPDTVSCPGDLDAKVGATLNCRMQVKGKPFNVLVTVTSVDGSNVKYDMVETVDKNEVASELKNDIANKLGHDVESVTCPDNLQGREGATLKCT